MRVTTDSKHYENMAAKIREKTGTDATYKPSEMPSGVDAVYKAGMQAEHDKFWDAYMSRRDRPGDFEYAFSYYGWTDETFNPTCDIVPLKARYMFISTRILNLAEILERNGVVLDTSKVTDFTQMFNSARCVHIPTIDMSSATITRYAFNSTPYLTKIDKLIVSEQTTFDLTFSSQTSLKDIVFEGVIGNSINLQGCPLSRESITSTIEHLSSTVTGQTLTLNLSAVNTAFETSSGAADGSTSAEFAALVATKTNWTITMV